ncbi:MAG: glycerol-3-phosphate 1-O-acyltransferase PlsY [Gammaproteobacteria bacterium]|jgi:glycerol-3-phosphate acyltransferase PlsY
MQWLLFTLGGYLIGSISSAVLISRVMGLPDPRLEGSGNPGATNVLRLGNKAAAALTLVGDLLKGTLPVLFALQVSGDQSVVAGAAAGAFLGHLFPVFFKFQGGKGVATALGVFLAVNPLMGLGLAVTWLATALVFRFSSLAALVAAASAPAWAWWTTQDPVYIALAIGLAGVLIWRHRANIRRLINGEESRIGKKS